MGMAFYFAIILYKTALQHCPEPNLKLLSVMTPLPLSTYSVYTPCPPDQIVMLAFTKALMFRSLKGDEEEETIVLKD